MAWAEYSSEALAARKMKISGNKGKETWTLALPTSVANWERDVDIAEYQADGWSETGADDAVDALVTDGHENAESSRSGESGKYMVRWTEETYGEWGLA
jgi:hypothetical protein